MGKSAAQSRCQQAFDYFSAMATEEELAILKAKPHDMDACLEVVMLIEKNLVKLLIQAYMGKFESAPKMHPHYELRPRQVSSHQLRGLPCQQDGHRPLQASPFTPLTLPTKPNPNLNLALTPTQPPLGRPSSAFAPLAPTAARRLA